MMKKARALVPGDVLIAAEDKSHLHVRWVSTIEDGFIAILVEEDESLIVLDVDAEFRVVTSTN